MLSLLSSYVADGGSVSRVQPPPLAIAHQQSRKVRVCCDSSSLKVVGGNAGSINSAKASKQLLKLLTEPIKVTKG